MTLLAIAAAFLSGTFLALRSDPSTAALVDRKALLDSDVLKVPPPR